MTYTGSAAYSYTIISTIREMEEKPVQKLLNAKMSRREFLGFLGAASLTVIGAASLLKGLKGLVNERTGSAASYGGGSYGGTSNNDNHIF